MKEQAGKSLALVEESAHDDTLSLKQSTVLKYFSEITEASPSGIAKATGVLLPTVRKALDRLIEIGKVKRVGRGRGTRYRRK